MDSTLVTKYLLKHPSLLIVLGVLALFTLSVVVLAEGFGLGLVSTSFVKTLGKTLFVHYCHCHGFGMGFWWDIIAWPFRLFRSWWLHDRHVADVCPNQAHCS